MRFLNQAQNQGIIAVLAIVSCFYGLLGHRVYLVIIGLYFLVYLCCKKQRMLVFLCFFCSLFLWGREQQLSVSLLENSLESQQRLTIFPDTIVVEGDQVTFDAQLDKRKIRAMTQVKTEKEQKDWQHRLLWDQEIEAKGEFETITPLTNQYGFNYPEYLRNNRYQGVFKITAISRKRPTPKTISWFTHWIRAKAIERVEQNENSAVNLVVNGLLFGYRQYDFYDELKVFTQNGLLHLFTISGMHVYFFLGWLDYFFRRVGLTYQQQCLPFLVASSLLSMLFGLNISIFRAILMYLCRWISHQRNWHLSSMDRYAGVLLLCLIIEPRALLQLSSQLSFGFSFFLLFLRRAPINNWWRRLLAAQVIPIMSAPLLTYFFYDWPILGGFFTFLLMPLFDSLLLPLATLYFVSCRVPLISSMSGHLLNYLMKGSTFFLQHFPLLHLATGKPYLIVLLFATVGSLWFYQKRRWILFVCWALACPYASHFLDKPEKITFIDIGQGDCIVLQKRWNREVYVIDTGGRLPYVTKQAWQKKKLKSTITYSLIPYLKGEGIRRIDGLFLTHGDTDHLGDAAELTRAIPVKKIYLGKGSSKGSKNIQKLLAELHDTIPIEEVAVGQFIDSQQKIQVLGPKKGKGENNDSLILYAHFAKQRLLLTGDLEKSGEEELIRRYPQLRVDILKAGHHGSKTSTSAQFIETIQPRDAIISCGRKNRYKHPHLETIQRLQQHQIRIYRTDQQGMIQYTETTPVRPQVFLSQ